MIKAFIFDMDGVLVDTQSVLDIDEFIFLKRITKNKWSKEYQKNIHGMSLEDVHYLLTKNFGLKMNKKMFLEEYDKINKKIYHRKARLIPGSLEFLKQISSQNYKIALASSSSHRLIDIILNRFGLSRYFNVVVSADDVKGRSKPKPDIFLLTAQKLNVSPQECVVIEDSSNGVKAAKRAGMCCIGYLGKGTSKNQDLKLADITLETFKNNDFDKLINQLLQQKW